ncbi:hypothetical protein QA649_04185 [Bradyrhizobium sp. CB1717]|uniref:hypothetical protein n=1 Tax=Bradyrhizobium sp. CB1717 TaxID=3039154 RepID=UPI0024B056BE|nr:hypothetical protein [Bradyrhizobium sp. CB1717]WFU25451.1 hypothetical protein QA649_04185 [Bradyrhizobium sp. CB1717]
MSAIPLEVRSGMRVPLSLAVTIFDPRLGVAKKMATQDVIWVERGQRIRTAQIARRPYRPNRKSSL